MYRLISITMLSILCGCTFSINQIHTEGQASDVVDEDQKANADVSPELTIPASVL